MLLNRNDAQTEDGRPMMKADTFYSFQHLKPTRASAEDMSDVHTWIAQQLSTRSANKGTWFTAAQAGIQHNARARVTKDQCRGNCG